jgi:hypothetical protein
MHQAIQGNYIGITPWWAIGLGGLGLALAVIIVAAIIALKGYALWNAAKRNEKWWFIIILVLNTLGILELIYLIFIVKKWNIGGIISSSADSSSTSTGTKV